MLNSIQINLLQRSRDQWPARRRPRRLQLSDQLKLVIDLSCSLEQRLGQHPQSDQQTQTDTCQQGTGSPAHEERPEEKENWGPSSQPEASSFAQLGASLRSISEQFESHRRRGRSPEPDASLQAARPRPRVAHWNASSH